MDAKPRNNRLIEMTDYYAIYRVLDYSSGSLQPPYPDHYYDDAGDYEAYQKRILFLDDRVLSFAVSLGEIDELQLETLLQMVRDKYPVEMCRDWSIAKTERKTVLMIDGSNINELSPAERIRFDRMLDLYKVAVGDNRFSPTLFEPLYFCIQCRDQIKEKAKRDSEVQPKTSKLRKTKRSPKGEKLDEKVTKFLYDHPEAQDWTQARIAIAVGCSTATVNKSDGWKKAMLARVGERECQKERTSTENSKRRHDEEIDKLDSRLDASD